MPLAIPHIFPLPQSEWNEETAAILEGLRRDGRVYNIFTTLGRHPQLQKRWLVFAGHVLRKSTLPAREREIVVVSIVLNSAAVQLEEGVGGFSNATQG